MIWVRVYSCAPFKAYIIKGRLEQENIPVKLQEETVAHLYGITVDGIGATKILVPLQFSKLAKSIIENIEKEDINKNS